MTDFEKIHSFESLYNAYRKARQGKRWKGAAAKFEVNLLEALNLLSAQIRTKRYTMSPYNTFEVYEPKRRVVMSNSYKDKVVQHSLCDNVLEPLRRRFGRIRITSGYRSPSVNAKVGGVATSQHTLGEAADINVPNAEVDMKMYDYIRCNLDFDQLIYEQRRKTATRWLHVSYRTDGNNRRQAWIEVK